MSTKPKDNMEKTEPKRAMYKGDTIYVVSVNEMHSLALIRRIDRDVVPAEVLEGDDVQLILEHPDDRALKELKLLSAFVRLFLVVMSTNSTPSEIRIALDILLKGYENISWEDKPTLPLYAKKS